MVVALGTSVVAMVAFAPAARAQTDGLRVAASKVFAPDTAAEEINVRTTYTLTNQQPDVVLGDQVRSTFYTTWIIVIPATATDLAATSGGAVLSTTIEPDEDNDAVALAYIALPYNLNFGQTVTVDVEYIIPGGEPREDPGTARVNESYLSFPIWANGDPGLVDVTIVVPSGFSTDLEGDLDPLIRVRRDEGDLLEALAIESPRDFFGQVFGRNDNGLLTRQAALPEGTATVRAWPDDPIWADFVVDTIEDDLPVLEDLIGLPWPAGDIEVIETVTPYLFGYGGWFNASSGVIEIGEDLDDSLILHELSHAWFNSELIGGRWITEGMAEEFASRTIEATTGEQVGPDEPDFDDPVRVPLAEWLSPWTLDDEDRFEYERYHYNASWWVMRQITDQIGLEAFADVLEALDQDEIPYPGEGPVEETLQSTRWTHLFDLLEAEGATGLDELFSTYVLSSPSIAKLEPRREARANYDSLVTRAGDWSAPLIVRRQLASWNFDDANDLIDQASEVLAVRDANDALAAELGVTIEHPAEAGFEMATGQREIFASRELEESLAEDLAALQRARESLASAAADIDATVAFAPSSFDDAVADIAVQQAAIDEVAQLRADVELHANELGLATPAWPVSDGPTDFAAAAALAEARLATLAAIENASTTVGASRSVNERVGLWGDDPDGALADARAAFETDDLDDALADTARAESLLAHAESVGRSRLTWAVVIAATLVLMALLFRHLRPSQHREGGVSDEVERSRTADQEKRRTTRDRRPEQHHQVEAPRADTGLPGSEAVRDRRPGRRRQYSSAARIRTTPIR